MSAGAPKWRLAELVRASLRDLEPHFKAKIARLLAGFGPFCATAVHFMSVARAVLWGFLDCLITSLSGIL